jgi:hypothetical protein
MRVSPEVGRRGENDSPWLFPTLGIAPFAQFEPDRLHDVLGSRMSATPLQEAQ